MDPTYLFCSAVVSSALALRALQTAERARARPGWLASVEGRPVTKHYVSAACPEGPMEAWRYFTLQLLVDATLYQTR